MAWQPALHLLPADWQSPISESSPAMASANPRVPVAPRDEVSQGHTLTQTHALTSTTKQGSPQKQFSFLRLPAEIRNKIYRYSVIHSHRITGLGQPALAQTNRQVRSEALPIYYSKNRFRLNIPAPSGRDSREDWATLIRSFRAFRSEKRHGRGDRTAGGHLRFIQDIRCFLHSDFDDRSSDRHWDMRLSFGARARCYQPPPRTVKFNSTSSDSVPAGAPSWKDRASVHAYFAAALESLMSEPSDMYFQRFVNAIAMVAAECDDATPHFDFKIKGWTRTRDPVFWFGES